jgi:hypothetical protein
VAKRSDEKLAGGVMTCGNCAATIRKVKKEARISDARSTRSPHRLKEH